MNQDRAAITERYKTVVNGIRIETSGPAVFLSFETGSAFIQHPFTSEETRKIGAALIEGAIFLDEHDEEKI